MAGNELCHLLLIYCVDLIEHGKDKEGVQGGDHMRVVADVASEASALMLAGLDERSDLFLPLFAELVQQLQRPYAPVCPGQLEMFISVVANCIAVQSLVEADQVGGMLVSDEGRRFH